MKRCCYLGLFLFFFCCWWPRPAFHLRRRFTLDWPMADSWSAGHCGFSTNHTRLRPSLETAVTAGRADAFGQIAPRRNSQSSAQKWPASQPVSRRQVHCHQRVSAEDHRATTEQQVNGRISLLSSCACGCSCCLLCFAAATAASACAVVIVTVYCTGLTAVSWLCCPVAQMRLTGEGKTLALSWLDCRITIMV